ncbi:hypothetical protein Aab01nite_04470 [Paractinoplanes abujensis]|uniref:Uncharacterized protein n=1 Tax=Paractinoplanes abujensis TaxID=882441 RepID=A0A7W7G2J3_9ACTN|nr:hypothetical protein [Actinoplanes abujensis]MBB4691721.1 hypothetical protein [Actinoplanes abujensis]GID16857.1 hypothetical protein Aab01nite_04470 [Actinoplanes abujensis]
MPADVLEQGGERRGFFSRPPGKALIAVLAVAAVAGIAVSEFQRRESREHRAAPQPAVSSLPFEPGRVRLADEPTQGSAFENTAKDFVLQVSLQNHNQSPARVRGMAMPDRDPAFARLAVAVMPGFATGAEVSYDEVAAAAARAVPLDPGAVAQLTVAGRLRCTPRPADLDWLMVSVEDQPVQVELPDFDGRPWPAYVAAMLCS